ncbi:kinase-like domain-containing protein [Circinella umbellata]|nr:kinase-like domain-containing protein [Circinella umbellata]
MRDTHTSSHKITSDQQIDNVQHTSDTCDKPLTRAQSRRLEMFKLTSQDDNKKRIESQTRRQQRQVVPETSAKVRRTSRSVRTKKVKNYYEPSLSQDEQENNKGPSNNITFPFPLKIQPSELIFQDNTNLGEGRVGQVITAKYGQMLVACKTRRTKQPRIQFEQRLARELEFAAILSVCRSMNPYLGVLTCKRSELIFDPPKRKIAAKDELEHFAIQRYYKHGDLLEYVHKKNGGQLHTLEVLKIAINLFSAIADAHNLDIGIVDIKRENVLIDTGGSAVLTDFGSCVKMNGADIIDLDDTEDGVCWTDEVAAPEMIAKRKFYLASDVFMTTLIVGELLMSPMSSEVFQKDFLRRKQRFGLVDFQVNMVPPPFRAFCPLLKQGLINDPLERLTASKGLQFLEDMYHASFDIKVREASLLSSLSTSRKKATTTTNDDCTIISAAIPSPTISTRKFTKDDIQIPVQKRSMQKDKNSCFDTQLPDQEQDIQAVKYDSSDALMRDGSLVSSGDERDLDCNELAIPDADDGYIGDEDLPGILHTGSACRPAEKEDNEYGQDEVIMRDDTFSNSSSNEYSDIYDKVDYTRNGQNEASGSVEPENDQVQVLNSLHRSVSRSTIGSENRSLNGDCTFSNHFSRKRPLQVYGNKSFKKKDG